MVDARQFHCDLSKLSLTAKYSAFQSKSLAAKILQQNSSRILYNFPGVLAVAIFRLRKIKLSS